MLELANLLYKYDYEQSNGHDSKDTKKTIISSIKGNHMLPLLERLCLKYGWEEDESLFSELR